MGKQADPLRIQARISRVEKSRRTQRDTRALPPWYYRVQGVSFMENREVSGSDFDEDLSEMEEDKEQESGGTEEVKEEEGHYKCGDDDCECDCQSEDDDMDEDDESERSYDGSDAESYYELKEEREARKQEKLRERKEKETEQEMERTKEEEVRAAYGSLNPTEKEAKPIPIESIAGQSFNLFCSEHVQHFYSDLYATKRVDFYHLDDTDNPHLRETKLGGEAEMLYGDVYLNADTNYGFGPFQPPKQASREAIKVKSDDGKYELSFKFIGNGYLKLSVSREMVFMNRYSVSAPAPPPTAPEVFEFVGIWRDLEKEKAERQEMMENARRSPSPRESWFEMNHPMGWWHQSRHY